MQTPGTGKQGNTTQGTPSGTQQYNGALLSGTQYTAQLFGGTTNTASENLTALLPVTTFRTGTSAGFIIAPPNAVVVPGVAEGVPAKILLRVWRNSGGITNWQQVLADPNIRRGESTAFISPPLGSVFTAPPNLIGLRSFNLYVPNGVGPIEITSGSNNTNGIFTLQFTATTNRAYSVHGSVDLTNWTTIATNLFLPASPGVFHDAEAHTEPKRFYRITYP